MFVTGSRLFIERIRKWHNMMKKKKIKSITHPSGSDLRPFREDTDISAWTFPAFFLDSRCCRRDPPRRRPRSRRRLHPRAIARYNSFQPVRSPKNTPARCSLCSPSLMAVFAPDLDPEYISPGRSIIIYLSFLFSQRVRRIDSRVRKKKKITLNI